MVWLRGNYLRNLLWFVPLVIVGLVIGGALLIVVVCLTVSLLGLGVLLVQIGRESRPVRRSCVSRQHP